MCLLFGLLASRESLGDLITWLNTKGISSGIAWGWAGVYRSRTLLMPTGTGTGKYFPVMLTCLSQKPAGYVYLATSPYPVAISIKYLKSSWLDLVAFCRELRRMGEELYVITCRINRLAGLSVHSQYIIINTFS